MKIKPISRSFGRLNKSLAVYILAGLACLLFVSCGKPTQTSPQELNRVRTLAGSNREFGEPFGVAIKSDVVYVSDGQNGKVMTVSLNGAVSTFAEGLDTPSGIAFDKNGDLFVADSGSSSIKKIDAAGKIVTIAGIDGRPGYADGDSVGA
jgi:glucose/arabinose dehydrogenase